MQDYVSVASQEAYRDHVGTVLGLAMAYILLKQVL